MLGIDVQSSRELQALILSVRQANKETAAQIRRHTKPMVETEWRKAVAEHADTNVQHVVLVNTARVTVSNQNITLKSGGLAKKLSGGAKAFEISKQYEFGASPHKITYQGRRGNKTFPVRRMVTNQLPRENRKGYVVYPAAAGIIPRIAALWVQTAVRTFAEALEGK